MCREQKILENSALNGTSMSHISPQGSGEVWEDCKSKMVPARGRVLQTQQDSGTHELTVVVTAYTRPGQAQARQNPRMGVVDGHIVPCLLGTHVQ